MRQHRAKCTSGFPGGEGDCYPVIRPQEPVRAYISPAEAAGTPVGPPAHAVGIIYWPISRSLLITPRNASTPLSTRWAWCITRRSAYRVRGEGCHGPPLPCFEVRPHREERNGRRAAGVREGARRGQGQAAGDRRGPRSAHVPGPALRARRGGCHDTRRPCGPASPSERAAEGVETAQEAGDA